MPAPNRPPVKGTSLLFDVFVLAQAVQEMLTAAMSGGPLTPAEYAVYSHLVEVQPCPPTQLARDLRVPATTVSDWVRTMIGRGHARQRRRPADRRSYEISLTAAGTRAHRRANAAFERANAVFRAELHHPEPELRGYLADIIQATRPGSTGDGRAGVARPGSSG